MTVHVLGIGRICTTFQKTFSALGTPSSNQRIHQRKDTTHRFVQTARTLTSTAQLQHFFSARNDWPTKRALNAVIAAVRDLVSAKRSLFSFQSVRGIFVKHLHRSYLIAIRRLTRCIHLFYVCIFRFLLQSFVSFMKRTIGNEQFPVNSRYGTFVGRRHELCFTFHMIASKHSEVDST